VFGVWSYCVWPKQQQQRLLCTHLGESPSDGLGLGLRLGVGVGLGLGGGGGGGGTHGPWFEHDVDLKQNIGVAVHLPW
jgi:hypothetical protein